MSLEWGFRSGDTCSNKYRVLGMYQPFLIFRYSSVRKVTYSCKFQEGKWKERKCPFITFVLTWAASSSAAPPRPPTSQSDKQAHLLCCGMLALKCVIEGPWLSYISPLMPPPCSELSSATAECEAQGLISLFLKDADVTIWKFGFVISYKFSCLSVSLSFFSSICFLLGSISWLPPLPFFWLVSLFGLSVVHFFGRFDFMKFFQLWQSPLVSCFNCKFGSSSC